MSHHHWRGTPLNSKIVPRPICSSNNSNNINALINWKLWWQECSESINSAWKHSNQKIKISSRNLKNVRMSISVLGASDWSQKVTGRLNVRHASKSIASNVLDLNFSIVTYVWDTYVVRRWSKPNYAMFISQSQKTSSDNYMNRSIMMVGSQCRILRLNSQ